MANLKLKRISKKQILYKPLRPTMKNAATLHQKCYVYKAEGYIDVNNLHSYAP
jgi:hypothetical protein